MKQSVAIAGNLIVDHVLRISKYPQKGQLESILDMQQSVGGCVPNTLIDLARMDKSLRLSGFGRVGKDRDGKYITDRIQAEGIDTSGIIPSDTPTSFTHVMSEMGGERTFFHYRGANAQFSPDDIDLENLRADILHTGYLLLLDKFDLPGAMPAFLKKAQSKGIKTSVDVVSENSDRFSQVVRPCLPHLDYLIINETEAGQIAGINPRSNGDICRDRIRDILAFFVKSGVKYAAIHCPEAGFSMRGQSFCAVPSLNLPKEYIKGTVGAGDAFCAGVLYGLIKGFADREILEYASLTAAANLSAEDSVGGARSYADTLKLETMFPRKAGIK